VPIGQTVNLTYPSPLVLTQYASDTDVWCVNAAVSRAPPAGYMVHVSGSGFFNYEITPCPQVPTPELPAATVASLEEGAPMQRTVAVCLIGTLSPPPRGDDHARERGTVQCVNYSC
jgi:hypothetical protein